MTESAHNPAYAHAAELKNIRFSYDRGNSWALDGVSSVSYTHLTLPTICSV